MLPSGAPLNAVLCSLVVVNTFTTPGATFLTTGAKLVCPPISRGKALSSTGGGEKCSALGFCEKARAEPARTTAPPKATAVALLLNLRIRFVINLGLLLYRCFRCL